MCRVQADWILDTATTVMLLLQGRRQVYLLRSRRRLPFSIQPIQCRRLRGAIGKRVDGTEICEDGRPLVPADPRTALLGLGYSGARTTASGHCLSATA